MKKYRISILGAGNLGIAIATGIRAVGIADSLILTRPHNVEALIQSGFNATTDNIQAVIDSDILILAVQPEHVDGLLSEIKNVLGPNHHLISAVSGISLDQLRAQTRSDMTIHRVMPNTAVSVGASMTCIASSEADAESLVATEHIFQAVGKTIVVAEDDFAIYTVLAGSGTALAMNFVDAYVRGAMAAGISKSIARTIVLNVIAGAVEKLGSSTESIEEQIEAVCTPDGCTLAALQSLEESGFAAVFQNGLQAGIERAETLYS